MAWKDQFRRASFRGVQFHVDYVDSEYGRRVVEHVYPQRDTPWNEDMGRKPRRHSVDAYLIGDNYLTALAELIDAVEKPGPGELVHPYFGTMRGNCTTLRVRQSQSNDGGMAILQLTFTETGENKFPNATINPVAGMDASAASSLAQAVAVFSSRFSLFGAASHVIEAAQDSLASANAAVEAAMMPLVAGRSEASGVARRIRGLASLASNIRNAPGAWATGVIDIASIVVSLPSLLTTRSTATTGSRFNTGSSTSVFRTMIGLADDFGRDFILPTPTTLPAQAEIQRENSAAIADFMRTMAVSQAARAAARTEWQTHDQAIVARQEIIEHIDDVQRQQSTPDQTYQALTDMRVTAIDVIPPDAERLARITRYTPPQTEPSLVAAYRLYADAQRGNEIATRNSVEHPGFLVGGQTLEVVVDG